MRTRMFVAAVLLLAVASGASAGIVNGNFATGDLTGWTVTGGPASAATTTFAGGALYQGANYCACLQTDWGGGSSAYQVFSANAGDTLSLAYQYTVKDAALQIQIMNYPTLTGVNTLASAITRAYTFGGQTYANTSATTQWQTISYTFNAAGTYELSYYVSGFFDGWSGANGTLDVADVQLTPAPEPATLSLLGLGLAGLIARRKRAGK